MAAALQQEAEALIYKALQLPEGSEERRAAEHSANKVAEEAIQTTAWLPLLSSLFYASEGAITGGPAGVLLDPGRKNEAFVPIVVGSKSGRER